MQMMNEDPGRKAANLLMQQLYQHALSTSREMWHAETHISNVLPSPSHGEETKLKEIHGSIPPPKLQGKWGGV